MDDMKKQISDLTQRICDIEQNNNSSKPKKKREKRPLTEKQKVQHARFKKAYEEWAPKFKKDNPNIKSHEIFKMVHAKLKE